MPGRRSGADIDLAKDAPVLVATWARMAAQRRLWQKVGGERPRDVAGAAAGVDVKTFHNDVPKGERLAGL
eukprot:11689403-Alexandrium_andersonii.AAC.1